MRGFVVEVEIEPGRIDDAVSEYQDVLLPALHKHESYLSSELFVDRDNQRVVWFGKWMANHCAGSAPAYLALQIGKLSYCRTKKPELREFESPGETDLRPTAM